LSSKLSPFPNGEDEPIEGCFWAVVQNFRRPASILGHKRHSTDRAKKAESPDGLELPDRHRVGR